MHRIATSKTLYFTSEDREFLMSNKNINLSLQPIALFQTHRNESFSALKESRVYRTIWKNDSKIPVHSTLL